jgi:hypothetical protein
MAVQAFRLPNLVIAGVGGAGTTSLFSYLAQHPDVCGSSVKEVQYFAPLKHGQPLANLDSYARYFSHCTGEKYAMESTPGYFYGGAVLVAAMRERLSDPRILVSLRDPSARLWSSFNYVRARLQIEKECSFDDYLERSLDAHRSGLASPDEFRPYSALATGFYAEHISPWFDAFGPAFRLVFFEDLVEDPRAVIEDVCMWLDIDPAPAADFDYSVQNRTVLHKSSRVQKLAIRVNNRGERFFRRHPHLKANLRQIYYGLNSEREPARFEPAARRRVDAVYAGANAALAAELRSRGYDRLPHWLQVGDALAPKGSGEASADLLGPPQSARP